MKPQQFLRNILVASIAALLAAPCVHAATVTWDANAATAGQTDGAGAWLDASQWWTGSANVDWTSGDSAIFGNGGVGGAVTLASPTTAGSLHFNFFTGTYTLGTTGQALTLSNGITKNTGYGLTTAGVVTIISPLTLGGAQTWTNNSVANINLQAGTTLNGAVTFGGVGNFDFTNTSAVISGSGNLIKNGPGQLILSAGGTTPAHSFTGDILLNGGSIGYQTSSVLSGRNVHITGGYLGGRSGSNFTWTGGLGMGANQIRITGGVSGFSGEGNSSSTFTIGTAGTTLIWGDSGEGSATGFFNPSQLLLNSDHRMNAFGKGTLNNGIDLNGTDRIITQNHANIDAASTSGFSITGAIISSTGTAGLTRTGIGNLILTANNTYDGATVIRGNNQFVGAGTTTNTPAGSITLSGANGRLSGTSSLALENGGTLRMVNAQADSAVDRLINGSAITVANGGGISWENTAGANSFAESISTVTVSSGLFRVNLTADQTAAGSQTLTLGGLSRSGTSTIAFSAGGTGPQASGNKNMIVITGAGTSSTINPWVTTGTAVNSQTDYATFSSDHVVPSGVSANNTETSWTSGADININAGVTLSADRTLNTLRDTSAAANTLALGANHLETKGVLSGSTATGTFIISGTGTVRTPTGGGSLYLTTGAQTMTIDSAITNASDSGVTTLVKSGTGGTNTNAGNMTTQGTLVLNGVNTYTGDTVINAGTLRIGTNNVANGAVLGGGNYTGNITINSGAMLYISTNANQTLSGVISGDGALMKGHIGTLTLSGNNTYTGRTSIAPNQTNGAGVLEVSSLNSVVGGTASSSLGAPKTVFNGTIDLGGPLNIQGPATLRYIGPGETTDRVVNIFHGSNTSRILDASGSGLLKFTSPFTSTGGTIAVGTTVQLIGTGSGEIVHGLPFAHTILTKAGSGTWTLGDISGHTGATNINGGVLEVAKIANGGKNSSLGVSASTNTNLNIASGATLRYIGSGDTTDRAFRLTGTGAGNNGIIDSSGTGALVFTNPAAVTNQTANIGYFLRLTGTNTDDNTLAADIDDNGTGARNITKQGVGKWILSGNSTYTGATLVSAGTLLVTGSLSGTSAVTVNNGGMLGGTGTIGGATTVNDGGKLSPGTSVGTLTFGSSLNLSNVNTAGSLLFELGTQATSDRVVLTLGTLNLGFGTLGFDDFAFSPVGGFGAGTYTLFDTAASIDGSLDLLNTSGFVGGLPATLAFADGGNDLVLNVIPEPSALAMLGLGALAMLRRRRDVR